MTRVGTDEKLTSGRSGSLADVVLDVLASDEQRRTRIAWLYHVEGRTQREIALRLGVSRVKVNRELALCRESGMVQVRINGRLASCVALERRLEQQFGLVEAIVVPCPERAEDIPAVLGIAVAAYVGERLTEGQTLAIGWGRTLRWSVRAMRRQRLARVTVVSLLGGLGRGSEINTYETAARLADVLGAQCYYLAAPTFVSTPELRDMLLDQGELRQILARARSADLAVVSVGSLEAESTIRQLGLLTAEDSASLAAAGAVGDLLGHLLDGQGRIVDHPLNRRVVGLPPADLRPVKVSVLASGGLEKAPIIGGVLRAGYVNRLITDERTAGLLAARPAG